MLPTQLPKSPFGKVLLLLAVVVGLAWYLYGCKLMWPANPHWGADGTKKTYDQVAYVNRAWTMAVGDGGDPTALARSRMPFYPFLMSLFYDEGRTEEAQFDIYKRLNIGLSALALIGMGMVATRRVGCALGWTITAITAFTVYLFKAVLVQPEVTFYFLYLWLFLVMIRSLRDPKRKQMILLGLLTGGVYFLKGSCLPMAGLYLLLLVFKSLTTAWKNRRATVVSLTSCLKPLAAPLLFLLGFLLVTGVYLYRSYDYYGKAIYEPNTTYYFWADSDDEMFAMQDLEVSERKPEFNRRNISNPSLQYYLAEKWLPDPIRRAELLKLVETQGRVTLEGEWDILPTSKYWIRHHNFKDAVDRFWNGFFSEETGMIYRNATHRDGYFWYLIVFGSAALVGAGLMFVLKRAEFIFQLKENAIALVFAMGTILGNFVLYAWWAQISSRNRFFLTQYMPLLVLMGIVIFWSLGRLSWEDLGWKSKAGLISRMRRRLRLGKPLLVVFLVIVWSALVPDVVRVARLDKPFYKKNQDRTTADVLLVQ